MREAWTAYAAWATDTLGLRLSFDGKRYLLSEAVTDDSATQASASDSRAARSWLRRSKPRSAEAAETPTLEAASPDEVFRILADRLVALPAPPSACPREQPTAVHEIARPLLTAYELDGGVVHVAGCRLEDRPIFRLTQTGIVEGDNPGVVHHYFDPQGEPLSAEWIEAMGADRVSPLPADASKSEHRIDETQLKTVRSAAETMGVEPGASVAVVWIKHVSGTLRFDFGEESLDTSFSGWARTLVAPPATCPATGVETFALSTVEGGGICAAEKIGVCSVTGHRRPLPELVRCSESGQLAEPEAIGACSISGKPVLKTLLCVCPRCGERVSPSMMKGDVCEACRKPQRISTSDPRVKQIVASRTGLARRRWSASETPTVLVLESTSWFRRRVVVFDRETLEPKHAAEASRFSPVWRQLPLGEV